MDRSLSLELEQQLNQPLPIDPLQNKRDIVGVGLPIVRDLLSPYGVNPFLEQPVPTTQTVGEAPTSALSPFMQRQLNIMNDQDYFAGGVGKFQSDGFTASSDTEQSTGVWGGVVRGLSSALEPLTLPQDVLFSVLGGALDPNKTIWGNLSEVEWSKYVPGGKAPKRVVSGEDLMGYLGVDDERGKRIGGVILDLVADPLLLGAAIAAAGKVSKVEKLVRLGTNIDKAMSAKGTFGLITGLGLDANKAENANLLGKFYLDRSEALLSAYRNPQGRIFGVASSSIKKNLVDPFASRTRALNDALGDFGQRVYEFTGQARQKGGDVYDESVEALADLEQSIFGKEAKPWLQKAFSIIGEGKKLEQNLYSVPTIMKTTMLKEAYDLSQRRGILLMQGMKSDEGFEVASKLLGPDEVVRSADDYDETLTRVLEQAKKNGLDEALVGRKFRQLVDGVTQIDSKLGYHTSGYEFVKEQFYKAVLKSEGNLNNAQAAWNAVLREGMAGKDITKLDFDTILANQRGAGRYRQDIKAGMVDGKVQGIKVETPELGGDVLKGRTVGSILEGVDTFSALNINTYIKALKGGHMRRAFGFFADRNTFDNYIDNVRNGVMIPSNIIDEDTLNLGNEFADLSKDIGDYLKAVRGGAGKKTGAVMTKWELTNHLMETQIARGLSRGEAAKRTRQALLEMQKRTSSNMDGVITRLQNMKAEFTKGVQTGFEDVVFRTGSSAFTAQRNEELSEEMLSLLGEFTNPFISLYEQAGASRRAIGAKEFLRSTYNEALGRGLIQTGEYKDKYGALYVQVKENEGVLGAFAGKYIHPYLYEEIRRGAGSTNRNFALSRVKNLITGGYLASPNVVVNNIFGGITTAAMQGINPIRMIKAMVETFNPLHQNGGRDYDVLKRLRDHISIDDSSQVTQDATSLFADIRLEEAGLGAQGLRGIFEKIGNKVAEQLQAPFGQRWAGLSGFQFVEKWMKTAVFKTEFDRLLASGLDEVGAERLAAESARTAVFDYDDLPQAIKFLRDTGVLMFPGYSYFLAGRTVSAMLERPGVLATADRISDAMNNLALDEEEKYAMFAGMPEWLKADQGTVFDTDVDEAGNKAVRVLPLAQMIPTRGFNGSPVAESLAAGGIYRPFLELMAAVATGEGEQGSAKYGTVVFTPESQGVEKVGEVAQYLYNTLAPAALRKIYSPVPGQRDKGLLPTLVAPEPFADTLYSYDEITKRREDRTFKDAVLSTTLRSPSVVTLSGPLSSVSREYRAARSEYDDQRRAYQERYKQALVAGDQVEAQKWRDRISKSGQDFIAQWSEVLSSVPKE